jgi:hypothetical protein
MALLDRWKPEPWTPTTAQEQTAAGLADPLTGARGRTLADGSAEIRTLKDGEARYYTIRRDGTARLIESRSASAVYKRLDAARTVVGWVPIPTAVWLLVAQATNFHAETVPWASGLVVFSLFFLLASEVVMNREVEDRAQQRQRIGGADF